MRGALLALIAFAGCGGGDTNGGRIEITREGGILGFRDTTHVVSLPLRASSKDHAFTQIDLPPTDWPGRVAFVDQQHGELVMVWITRLGAKRPENIQRWFDERLAKVSLTGGQVVKDEGTKFGEHPARIADSNAGSPDWSPGHYTRFIGVDLPEHDLEVLVVGVIAAPAPSPAHQAWLDDLTADVRAMTVAPAK